MFRKRGRTRFPKPSAVSTTSTRCMATQSCKRNELLKSTMRLDKSPVRGSSQDSWRAVRSKPHSAQASRALGTRGRATSPVLYSSGHSLSQTAPAFPLLLKQPLPLTLKPWTVKIKPLLSCKFKKQPRQWTRHGSKRFRGTTVPPSPTHQC